MLSDEKLWYKDASTMTRFERENRAGTTGVVARRTEYLRIARHQFRNIHLSHSTLTFKKYIYMYKKTTIVGSIKKEGRQCVHEKRYGFDE